eukprot:scaffold116316_cov28-Tisochrysis_lutea.AAC.1
MATDPPDTPTFPIAIAQSSRIYCSNFRGKESRRRGDGKERAVATLDARVLYPESESSGFFRISFAPQVVVWGRPFGWAPTARNTAH